MFYLGNKRRVRLSGIMANFCQIMLGALFVSRFFSGAPGYVKISAVVFILLSLGFAVTIEPEDKDKKVQKEG